MSEIPAATKLETDHQSRLRRVNVGKKFLQIFRSEGHSISDPLDKAVLPASIRYAMAYRGAQLSGKEVEILYKAGLPRPAFYLAMKAADAYNTVQTKMLQRLAKVQFNYDKLTIEDIRLGTATLNGQNGQNATSVAGEKLGQFSRHGFTGDLRAFDKVLSPALVQKPDASLFMVANYPYIALDVLAKHSLDKGNQLGVINPDHIGKNALSTGFIMEGQGSDFTINSLGQDFNMPEEAVIFDDVVREGKTRDIVMAWAGRSMVSPSFVSAGRVPVTTSRF